MTTPYKPTRFDSVFYQLATFVVWALAGFALLILGIAGVLVALVMACDAVCTFIRQYVHKRKYGYYDRKEHYT